MNPAQAGQQVRPYMVGHETAKRGVSAVSLAPVAGGEH